MNPNLRKTNSSFGNWAIDIQGKYTIEQKYFFRKKDAQAYIDTCLDCTEPDCLVSLDDTCAKTRKQSVNSGATCPDCNGNVKSYHSPGITRVVCLNKCNGWKVIRTIYHNKKAKNND